MRITRGGLHRTVSPPLFFQYSERTMICSSIRLKLAVWLILAAISALAMALPRAKDYRGAGEVVASKNIASEPTCEQLKAMWRLSKRQSRNAEITNEIPMFKDPFADNVWEPYYATSRSVGGMRIGRYRNKPIYGRIVHNPPYLRIQDPTEKHKAFEEVARMYGAPPRQDDSSTNRKGYLWRGAGRYPGGGILPQQGSFQHLKELIKTERARELQQQRVAEEEAARAASMKDLSRNENHRNQGVYEHYDFESEDDMGPSYMSDDADTGSTGGGAGVISFPDLLAPASRPQGPSGG
ncbi:hypothetical protein NQ315_010270 [Exocentrus adspersus]|uniref:Uncharacterized protein n=1 Tax=Exocentrus adspersus TaxID=1586481 RepID=A0AAV8WAX5_9CUCU|nr:hypothetical protein NQ315_010270 [Exocentrus adspersus]